MTSKIPAKRVKSDDCEVVVGQVLDDDGNIVEEGTVYRVHEGEWVDVIPVSTLDGYFLLDGLQPLQKKLADPDLSDDQKFKAMNQAEQVFDRICDVLAKRIISWNWTDMDSKRLPNPYKEPDVLKQLSIFEIRYLLAVAQGETQVERKNV